MQAWHRPPLLWRGKRCPHALRGVPGGGTAASATPTLRERPSTPTHTRHPAAQAAPHPPSPRPPKPQRHTASSRPPSSPHSTPLPPLRRSLTRFARDETSPLAVAPLQCADVQPTQLSFGAAPTTVPSGAKAVGGRLSPKKQGGALDGNPLHPTGIGVEGRANSGGAGDHGRGAWPPPPPHRIFKFFPPALRCNPLVAAAPTPPRRRTAPQFCEQRRAPVNSATPTRRAARTCL